MKNLINCHVKGLHSFILDEKDGLYRRIFCTTSNHELWKTQPLPLAIHPHHVNIKISVLKGELVNITYKIAEKGSNEGQVFGAYKWNSVILNGKGGFESVGEERIVKIKEHRLSYKDSVYMEACELHTVFVEHGENVVWLIEEEKPSCEYFPINYSDADLTQWSAKGLYKEVDDEIRDLFVGEYLTI